MKPSTQNETFEDHADTSSNAKRGTQKKATQIKELAALLACAALSGGLLFSADHPWHLWYLGAVALVPFFYGMIRWSRGWLDSCGSALVLGAFYVIPLSIYLEFPFLMGAGLAVYLIFLWGIFGAAFHLVGRWPAPWSVPAVAGAMVLIEWFDFTVVPVWGTAQSFTRTWSAAPWSIQIVELTGVLGVVFLVVSINMGAAALLARPDDRRQHLVTVLVLMTIAVAGNGLPQLRTTKKGPKVAAIGWTEADVHGPAYSRNTHRIYEGLFLPMFRRAVATEAELIVAPEMTFRVRKAQRRRLFARLRELTRTHRVTLVVGYILADKKENRAVCFGPKGNILADYQKTHLVPYIEKLHPGPGKTTPISLRSKGAGNNSRPLKLGVMICQDDNFTDVARAYGRAGTQIMAVPTNDWRQVKDHHFENSLFRAVENRYAIVRAASNGISALISPRGRVLARVDHFEKGPTVIAARLPVMSPSATLYSLAGDWPAALCAALLVVGFVVFRRRQE